MGRPVSAGSEVVWNMDSGKLQVTVCVKLGACASHTQLGAVRLKRRPAPGPVCSLACAPVSGAGRHLADLEFPLGDGPRCTTWVMRMRFI